MSKTIGKYVFESVSPEKMHISSNIEISVVNTIEDLWGFYRVPWKIYRDDVYWVAPFWKETRDFFRQDNPFWRHSETRLFVAYKNNIAVGRIAAIIDHNFSETNGEKVGYFGFFESIPDFKIASALFEVAQKWLASKGITEMHGPINGRIDLGCGFLLEGFNSMPFMLTSYSPKYYLDFVEDFGMEKSSDLVAYYIDLRQPIPSSVEEVAKRCEKNGVKIRRFNRFRFEKEMHLWFKMWVQIFSDHWGYALVSYEELKTRFGVKQLKWIINPKLFLVAEIDNEPIGFRWSLPNYNQIFKNLDGKLGFFGSAKFLWYAPKIIQGKFIIMGIKKEYRGQGIGTCMNYHTLLEMKKKGYTCAEYGWIEEYNIASRRCGEKIGGKLYKKYRVYKKNI